MPRSPTAWTLLCDLDGTLVDSLPDLADALGQVLRAEGAAALPEAAVRTMVGDGVAKLVERGLAAAGLPPGAELQARALTRFVALYEDGLALRTRPYPGTVDALRELRDAGWRLAVLTNKPERATRALLESLEILDLFEALAGGDTFEVRKPDPRHAYRLLDAMAAPRGLAVVFGDSENDALCARRAGLPIVALAQGYGRRTAAESGADVVIESPAELPLALAQIVAARSRKA